MTLCMACCPAVDFEQELDASFNPAQQMMKLEVMKPRLKIVSSRMMLTCKARQEEVQICQAAAPLL